MFKKRGAMWPVLKGDLPLLLRPIDQWVLRAAIATRRTMTSLIAVEGLTQNRGEDFVIRNSQEKGKRWASIKIKAQDSKTNRIIG